MPRPSKGEREAFTVRVTQKQLDRLDEVCIKTGYERSEVIGLLLDRSDVPKLIEAPKASRAKSDAGPLVQFGPSKVVPGSRLKKAKGEKP